MSEFFLELFTEEMPPSLQNNAKIEFLEILKNPYSDQKKFKEFQSPSFSKEKYQTFCGT